MTAQSGAAASMSFGPVKHAGEGVPRHAGHELQDRRALSHLESHHVRVLHGFNHGYYSLSVAAQPILFVIKLPRIILLKGIQLA